MFDATLELITQATSNSLFIFCFCNLIIAILLIGSLKPSSYSDQETAFPFSVVTNMEKNDGETASTEGLMDANEVSDAEKGVVVNRNKEDDSEDNSPEEEEEEEEEEKEEEEEEEEDGDEDGDDNDELRRRAEEFIEKINRGWRAEMLRTASLIQTENLHTRHRKIHAV